MTGHSIPYPKHWYEDEHSQRPSQANGPADFNQPNEERIAYPEHWSRPCQSVKDQPGFIAGQEAEARVAEEDPWIKAGSWREERDRKRDDGKKALRGIASGTGTRWQEKGTGRKIAGSGSKGKTSTGLEGWWKGLPLWAKWVIGVPAAIILAIPVALIVLVVFAVLVIPASG